jgi:hypothetical protein
MVLRENVIAGTPQMVVERLRNCARRRRDGVSAEINPGSLLSHEQVVNSLRLYCQKVMPKFNCLSVSSLFSTTPYAANDSVIAE